MQAAVAASRAKRGIALENGVDGNRTRDRLHNKPQCYHEAKVTYPSCCVRATVAQIRAAGRVQKNDLKNRGNDFDPNSTKTGAIFKFQIPAGGNSELNWRHPPILL